MTRPGLLINIATAAITVSQMRIGISILSAICLVLCASSAKIPAGLPTGKSFTVPKDLSVITNVILNQDMSMSRPLTDNVYESPNKLLFLAVTTGHSLSADQYGSCIALINWLVNEMKVNPRIAFSRVDVVKVLMRWERSGMVNLVTNALFSGITSVDKCADWPSPTYAVKESAAAGMYQTAAAFARMPCPFNVMEVNTFEVPMPAGRSFYLMLAKRHSDADLMSILLSLWVDEPVASIYFEEAESRGMDIDVMFQRRQLAWGLLGARISSDFTTVQRLQAVTDAIAELSANAAMSSILMTSFETAMMAFKDATAFASMVRSCRIAANEQLLKVFLSSGSKMMSGFAKAIEYMITADLWEDVRFLLRCDVDSHLLDHGWSADEKTWGSEIIARAIVNGMISPAAIDAIVNDKGVWGMYVGVMQKVNIIVSNHVYDADTLCTFIQYVASEILEFTDSVSLTLGSNLFSEKSIATIIKRCADEVLDADAADKIFTTLNDMYPVQEEQGATKVLKEMGRIHGDAFTNSPIKWACKDCCQSVRGNCIIHGGQSYTY